MGIVEFNEAENTLLISSIFILYGGAASNELAVKVAGDVQDYWNGPNGVVTFNGRIIQVRFKIDGYYKPYLEPEEVLGNDNPANNYFRIEEQTQMDVSFVDGIGSNTGFFKLANLLQTGSTAAHEYGHTIGLDHPFDIDIRGRGVPGIMYPRGTITNAQYQYNPLGVAGDNTNGGTMNPDHRRVTQQDIDDLQLSRFRKNRYSVLGDFSSVWHDAL